ncbi:hypothetical protein [Cronobacter muytjensii]
MGAVSVAVVAGALAYPPYGAPTSVSV